MAPAFSHTDMNTYTRLKIIKINTRIWEICTLGRAREKAKHLGKTEEFGFETCLTQRRNCFGVLKECHSIKGVIYLLSIM